MTIKQMLYTLIKRPHIVEQGESGGWTYRKWSDGTAECWARKYQETATSTAYNNFYVSPALSYDFPFTFTEIPVVQMTPNPNISASVFLITGNVATKTNTGTYYLTSFSSRSAIEYNIHVYAIGKWK